MTLRLATLSDYERVFYLVSAFHAESPYGDIPMKASKVNETILSFLDTTSKDRMCVLLCEGDKPVGLIAGMVSEPVFCDLKIAHELVWYVLPLYRNGLGPMKLRKAFEYWAENVAEARFTHMASLNNDHADKLKRHYEKKGYKLFEYTFLKDNNGSR